MERSIFAIALAYGATALLGAPGLKTTARKVTVGLAAAFALSAVFFPFGKMERVHFAAPLKRWSPDPDSPVVVREGASETILYIERRFAERTRSHRMVTNGVSMSASDFRNRRYMKLFVYWPIALHPAPRKALLVCFGVGATAKALTDTRELETIDVVDVSKDVLEMRTIVHRDPAEDPLRDPRVRVHVEDGRFFLQTTSETFDLVTGEPPPPNLDGVEALYSLEYFRLVRDRLRPGGISTYWLPTHSLAENNARAVTRAFCDVFEDCSLWAGFGTDLILVGSRGASGPESEARFVAQWEDARVNTELTALGIEAPEQLGALMLADAEELRRLTASDLPTVDDFPRRITPPTFFASYATSGNGLYALWTDSDARRARFERSDFIKKRWPAAVRERTLDQFAAQAIFDRFAYRGSISLEDNLPSVHELLETTKREAPVLWMLGSDPDVQRIIDGLDPTERQRPDVAYHVACKAISERRFAAAIAPLERAEADAARRFSAVALRAYVLARIDRRDEAKTALAEARQRAAGSDKAAKLVTWLGGILEPKGAD
jgi:spermidine synthase